MNPKNWPKGWKIAGICAVALAVIAATFCAVVINM